MEDPDEIASYRLRPLSRASSHVTPTSSHFTPSPNNSSINLPSRGSASTEMSERREASSAYLQERLKERRTETLKVNKHRRGSEGIVDDRNRVASSPTVASSNGGFGDRRPTTSNGGASERKGSLGVKGVEEAMDKLQKQNWDFKLEIYHRRQKQEELEKKNAALEDEVAGLKEKLAKAQSCQTELQGINEEVVAQLEVHDQAVEEAVRIICDLEAKIELKDKVESLDDAEVSRDLRSSPPPLDYLKTDIAIERESPKTLKRMPSFLSDKGRSTEALRLIFRRSLQPDDPDLPELAEEGETAESEASDGGGRHSPQLSVLSESSFKSVYGGEATIFTEKQDEKAQLDSTVKAWIDERPVKSVKPILKDSPASLLPRHDREKYLSLDHVASSPIRRIDGIKHRMQLALKSTTGVGISSTKNEADMSRKSSGTAANIRPYEYAHDRMPPTPDTMSTLHHQQNSYDTLPKSRGSDDEKSSGVEARSQSNSNEASNIIAGGRRGSSNICPGTAEELMTSVYDSHGWGTDSESDEGRLSEDESVANDPWLASAQESGKQKRKTNMQPPPMFDFSSRGDSTSGEYQFGASDLIFGNPKPVSRRSFDRPRQPVLTASKRSVSTSGDAKDKYPTKVDLKDSKISNAFNQRSKSVPLKMDKRAPRSFSSTSNTPTSNPTTPFAGATKPSIGKKNSLSKRSRLPGFLGGRSETLSSIPTHAEKANAQSPSTQPSQRSHISQFKKKRNSISVHSSPSGDPRRNPLTSPHISGQQGSSNSSPAVRQHVRRASGLRVTSGSKSIPGRPSTAGSLDSKLPVPKLGLFATGAKNSQTPAYSGIGKGFGGDGACDDYEVPDIYIHANGDFDVSNHESKMEKIKGAVLKTLGRR